MSRPDAAIPGFYGKLPAVGDFVSRRLPGGFLDVWDEWLQRGIAASHNRLQDQWLNLYLTSPIWRFALAPGVCGPHAWAGVLMPSVDRVGRYFPLTIALALPDGASPIFAVKESDWFERAEQAALSVLDEDGSGVEQFDRAVAGLGAMSLPVPVDGRGGTVSGGAHGWRLLLPGSQDADQLLAVIAHPLLERYFGPYGIWWSEGSDEVEPQMLLRAGLPAADVFSDMLGAGWQPDAWDAWPAYGPPGETGEKGQG